MDEQLESTFEGTGVENQPVAPVSPSGEAGITEEKTEEATPAEVTASAAGAHTSADDSRPPCLKGDVSEADRGIPQQDEIPPRDHYAEWQELAAAHPEIVGKELPEDIYQACMQSELPPVRVYESMMLQKQAEQIAALQQEIAMLQQNAENTARAPVSAAAGSPENEPEDLFLKGFNSY